MKTVEEMKNMIMVCLKEMISDADLLKKLKTSSHNKRLSDQQFLEFFANKYGEQTIREHGANNILNLFTTELNMKWVSDGKRTVLDNLTIGGMVVIDYINGYQLSDIEPKEDQKVELTEEEQLEALYGKMFENRVIDQTIAERGREIPHKARPEPVRIRPIIDEDDEYVDKDEPDE
jgi:hypothetical protein